MAQELSQFNFKLPATLLKQLKELAKAKEVTATELIIQGIRQVLGFNPDSPLVAGIDSSLYQQLDSIEQRIQELTDYQSAVDIKTDKRIKALEETVKLLNSKLSELDIAEKATIKLKTIEAKIVEDIDPDSQLGKKPLVETIKVKKLKKNLDTQIDESVKLSKPEETSAEPTQLEIVNLKNLSSTETASDTVDSIEMLKILKAEDPQENWDNDRLTSYRRNKSLKDKWHDLGSIRFKYSGESKKAPKSRKTVHLWQIDEVSKIKT